MCGICGWLGPAAGQRPEVLNAMLATLVRRGPDQEGRFEGPGVALGVRRLAVLDPAHGAQPRVDQQTGVQLFYNGELYNHRELGRELKGRGHTLRGTGDSEVLLRAWLEWGPDCLQRLNGMFALCVWDPRDRSLTLARDHLGQKPLHYWHADDTLIFGSELRTVLAHPQVPRNLDDQALAQYLRLRHVPGPQTLIAGVRQLPPACMLRFGPGHEPQLSRFWSPRFEPDPHLDLSAAVEEFASRWPAAVRRHLISDVPLGAFLSGGIDSGLVAAEASRAVSGFRTFSVAFGDPGFDETPHALRTARALGCEHEVFSFDESLESLLAEWAQAYDQPFADPAAFPTLILARETRQRVTVALTGDGGDELFAGYQRYRSMLLGRRLARLPRPLRGWGARVLKRGAAYWHAGARTRRWLEAAGRRLELVQSDPGAEYQRQFWTWDQGQLATVLEQPPAPPPAELPGGDLLAAMLHHDLEHWLPDQMLVKMDRASMAHSLEARLPFLDREIVDLALRIPSSVQIAGGTLKRVLREVARTRLPAELAQRPKHGFAVPVDRWLRDEQGLVSDILDQGLARGRFPLRPQPIQKLWSDHVNGHRNHGERLLTLLILFTWDDWLSKRPTA